jgi:hypothetical protein
MPALVIVVCDRHNNIMHGLLDQSDLTASLRVLPVNVQACERVLVLCGKTYCNRLWCVWELYVVFAFAPREQAATRVQIQVLEGEGEAAGSVPQRLSEFELLTAHCYDPNEEHKIRRIIQECGQSSFESHVRELSGALA